MGVGAKWGRFPICPEISCFVPVCPLLSRFVPVLGPKKDIRGQTGTKRDISAFSIHPHVALLDNCFRITSVIISARMVGLQDLTNLIESSPPPTTPNSAFVKDSGICKSPGYVNGGFQTVVRVLSGGRFPPPPF